MGMLLLWCGDVWLHTIDTGCAHLMSRLQLLLAKQRVFYSLDYEFTNVPQCSGQLTATLEGAHKCIIRVTQKTGTHMLLSHGVDRPVQQKLKQFDAGQKAATVMGTFCV